MLESYDSLRLAADRDPIKLAITGNAGTRTYEELLGRTHQAAQAFRELGVQSGDRISVVAENGPEILEISYAAAFAGCTFVPINPHLSPPELETILERCSSRVIVAGERCIDTVSTACSNLGIGSRVVALGEPGEAWGGARYEKILQQATARSERIEPDHSTPEAIFYSSGTTGLPKGVLRTAEAAAWIRVSHIIEWGFASDDVNLTVGPLCHNSYLAIAQMHLALGGTVVLERGYDPERVIDACTRYGVTTAFLVPTMLSDITQLSESRIADSLSCIKTLISSGAPLPDEVRRYFLETGLRASLNESYGWTEVMFATNLPPNAQGRAHQCVGRPFLGTEVRLRGENDGPIDSGEVGRIEARLPVGFAGYLDDPKRSSAALNDGFVRSGDLGMLDDEGYLYVLGRTDDLMICGGENIYPQEIEESLRKTPGVAEVAVVAMDDPRLGEVPRAFVVPMPGWEIDAAYLYERWDSQLARFKIPRSVDIVEELPRNAMGKILRRELRCN